MIYFIRHGESESNRDKVFAGRRADVELTDAGRQQAKEAGLLISKRNLEIRRIICSPLKRTAETARIISNEIGFLFEDIIFDERLSEYDLGINTGKPVRDISAYEIVNADGAEEPSVFLQRIKNALDEYSVMIGDFLVVSHGGVSRMIKCFKEGGDINAFPDTLNYKNADLIELDWK